MTVIITKLNCFTYKNNLGSNLVYRVCTAEQVQEILNKGYLAAKNPDAGATVTGHVMSGSRINTQFVSTSKTLFSAYCNMLKYGGMENSACSIISIDVSLMEDDGLIDIINVSDKAHAAAVFGSTNTRAINMAAASQELVFDCSCANISAKAIRILSRDEMDAFLDSEDGIRLRRRVLGL